MDTLKIKKVNKGTNLSDKLICFVENFSWEDVKYHMLGELADMDIYGLGNSICGNNK